ncbi:hypothetical protein CAPTEDRAFT_189629 [Capitella teleta]|uniref:Uncharacterized protein n=1 Tax=Capitella teleta TaxID=283909 RepID=R7V7W2_CAPTE|nr:hypothetical protein CAPTEDRAFT_189629 [Capitella teleta]|eukprot:ELU14948.1 hypothetical protein CAPTEDRAFT_189629 [Capitella teleta]
MARPMRFFILAAVVSVFYPGVSAHGVCSVEAEEAMLQFGYYCVHDLVIDFRKRDGRGFPSIFYHLAAWNKICRGLSLLPNCIESIGEFATCDDVKRTEIIQAALTFVNSEWGEIAGFHPTPETCKASAGSAPMYNDHISRLYNAPTDVCKELVTTTIDKCTKNWLIAQTITSPEAKSYSVALQVYKCVLRDIPTKCGRAGRNLAKFIVDQTMPEDLRKDISMDDIFNQDDSAEDEDLLPQSLDVIYDVINHASLLCPHSAALALTFICVIRSVFC